MTMLDGCGFTERLIMLDESHFELAAGVNKKKSLNSLINDLYTVNVPHCVVIS
jgi:hypothetical protein